MSTALEVEPLTDEMLDAEIGCEIKITKYAGDPMKSADTWLVVDEVVCGHPVIGRLKNLCPCSKGKLTFVCRCCLDMIEAGHGACINCHKQMKDWRMV